MVRPIQSAENETVKRLKALRSAKGRRELGLYLAEGPHLVQEALLSGAKTMLVAVCQGEEERYAGLLQGWGQGTELISLPRRLLEAVSEASTPQGILAAMAIPRLGLEWSGLKDGRIAVVLESLQDPGNVGTMLRTALAVGSSFALLCGACADPWSPKVVRSSQGAVMHLPIVEAGSGVEAVQQLGSLGWHTACGHLKGEDFFKRPQVHKTAVVIGNEAAGITDELAAACGGLYRLPMPGGAESLNAAVAAGIMLYDVWRRG